jgi:hypothetical protein
MACVKTKGDRGTIFGANASVRAQQQDLRPRQCTGIPPHTHVLTKTKETTRGPLQQHVRSHGEGADGTAGVRRDGLQHSGVLRFKHRSE